MVPTRDRCERARLVEELQAGAPAARADLERRPADWLLPPKPKEDVLPPHPKEDALPPKPKEDTPPPAPQPDAAPFTKDELIDGIAHSVHAVLAPRDTSSPKPAGQ